MKKIIFKRSNYRRLIFIFIYLLIFLSSKSQNSFLNPVDFQSIIPPSPNSSEISKYIDMPVDYFTGIPGISFTLYEIKGNDYSIPITLSYHASGIKVGQLSSSVGLGWSLNAGGIVTRSVRGLPDDCYYEYTWTEHGYPYYLYPTQQGRLNNSIDFELIDTDILYEGMIAHAISTGVVDGEPDIFYYSYFNQSGKFILDNDGNVKLIPKCDNQISYSREENGKITGFTIITEGGIKLVFTDIETTDLNLPNNFEYNSTWVLSSVISQTDLITFSYDTELIEEKQVISENSHIDEDGVVHVWDNYSLIPILTHKTKRIKRIDWSNGYILFNANNVRLDTKQPDASLKSKSIDEIIVYHENEIIKKYGFTYRYSHSTDIIGNPIDSYLGRRLMLSDISIVKNSFTLPFYSFSYYGYSLPPRNSFKQDYWGFYNNNGGSTFIPNLWAYPDDENTAYLSHHSIFKRETNGQEYFLDMGEDRSPNSEAMKVGILEKISYPSGGCTEYEYEPHEFYFDGKNRIGGGLRIKKITSKSNLNEQTIEKEFKYTFDDINSISSGKILTLPEFAFWRTNVQNVVTNLTEMRKATMVYTNSIANLDENRGSHINYSIVTEIQNGNGKIVRKYSLSGTAEDLEDECENNLCIYERSSSHSPIGVWYCWYNYPIGQQDFAPTIALNDNFPYGPNPNYQWNSGDLIEEVYYSENDFNNPAKKIIYNYVIKNYEKIPALKCSFYGFRNHYVDYDCQYMYELYGNTPPSTTVEDLTASSEYYLLSAWKVLESKSEYLFDGTEQLESKIIYNYDSPFHSQITSIEKLNSDERFNKTTFTYPFDTDINTEYYTDNSVIDKMKQKNMKNLILLTEESKDETKIAGAINAYQLNQLNTNNIIPKSLYLYEPGSYHKKRDYVFDEFNNIIESIEEESVVTCYVWGYNYKYPILKIENAYFDDVIQSIGLGNNGYEILQTKSSEELKGVFQNLITNSSSPDHVLYNTKINAYTYDPLVGITSEIDQNGLTKTYIYDELNRLITVKDNDGNILKHYEYNLTGAQINYYMDIDPDLVDANYGETGPFAISIETNDSWTIELPESDQSWVSCSPLSGTGDGSLSLTLTQNQTGLERSCIITIHTSQVNDQVLTVVQKAHP